MTGNRVESIQALRAVAAILVVVFHAMGSARYYGYAIPTPVGSFGVDIFFVISGFVMVLTSQRPSTKIAFFKNRLARIVPIYWLLTSFKILILLMFSASVTQKLSLPHILSSYLFIPWYDPSGEPYPIINVGWTLTYELWFYAIFAALTFRVVYVAIACLVLTLLGTIEGGLIWNTLTDPLLLEFVMGMAIGCIYLKKNFWIPAIISCAVVFFPDSRAFYWGIPSAILVLTCVSLEKWWPKTVLSNIGDSSYSLYLTHIFILSAYFSVINRIGGIPSVVAVVGLVAISIITGHIVYKFVELPLQKLVKHWMRGGSSSHQSSPPGSS